MKLEEKQATRIVFSDSGKPIVAGEKYYVHPAHGREVRLTQDEAKLLLEDKN